MTLGVRIAAFARDGTVGLVRHTYLPGWYLPGGGVEPGEPAIEAARRELREETGLDLPGDAVVALHGAYWNRAASRRDHVLLFVVRDVEPPPPPRPSLEIAEAGFFPPAALPGATTPATRARLREIATGEAPSPIW